MRTNWSRRGRHNAGRSPLARPARHSSSCSSDSVFKMIRRSPFFSSGTAVTTNICSLAPASSWSFSSTLMWGTISPPILLKRLSRSVTRRKPSSSTAAMSPVLYQPSRSTSAVSFRAIQIALHHVGAADEQKAGLIDAERLLRFGIDNFYRDAREGMPDAAALCADLTKRGGPEIDGVDRYHRRAFRAAVTLQRTDAEVVFKGHRHALRQFFRSGHYEAQAAELFRSASPQVTIKKSRSCQQHCDGIFVDQRADHA